MFKISLLTLLGLAEWAWLNAGMRPTISFRVSDETQLATFLTTSRKECNAAVDLVFLLDGSYSVLVSDWKALKEFVSQTVSRFNIGPDKMQVGFVQYTQDARIEMRFKSAPSDVAQGLVNLDQKGGNTNLSDGLVKSRELFLNHTRKEKASRFLIIVSDGDVDYQAPEKARQMEQEDRVIIFSLAVGEDADVDDLRGIATGPQLFFQVSQYGILDKIVKTISKDGCLIAEQGRDMSVRDINLAAILGKQANANVTSETEEEEDSGSHHGLLPGSSTEESAPRSASIFDDELEDAPVQARAMRKLPPPKAMSRFASVEDHSGAEAAASAQPPAVNSEYQDESEVSYLRKRVEELQQQVVEAKLEAENRPPCPEVVQLGPTLQDVIRLEEDMMGKQKEMVKNQEGMKEELEKLSEQDAANASSGATLQDVVSMEKEVMSNQQEMVQNQENMKDELSRLSEQEAASTTSGPSLQDVVSMEKEVVSNQQEMVQNQENMKEELERLSEQDARMEQAPVVPVVHPAVQQESSVPSEPAEEISVEVPTTSAMPATTLATTTEPSDSGPVFKGKELQDEEADAVSVQTAISDKCFLDEVARKFLPVFEGWLLLTSLAKRLKWEELGAVLATFRQNVATVAPDMARLESNGAFAWTFGEHLEKASEKVNFTNAQLLKAEYMDFTSLGLPSAVHRAQGKKKESLQELQSDLCHGMRKFLTDVKAVESGTPEVRDPVHLWHMWQESWGAVRIFIKVTTQCRIEIPKGQDPRAFMTRMHEDQWKKCVGAIPFQKDQFPSAVMACARSDEKGDRNRVVRYFGCGKNRVMTEPPVSQGVMENCERTADDEVTKFMYSMCGNGDISTQKCRLYGPFWGIYSHPAEDLYGYHSLQDKEECLAKESDPSAEQCPEPQAVAFKGQFNRAMADYIYGTPPPLTHSRSKTWQKSTKLGETSWDPDEMLYSLPQDRKLDPPLWEMLREAEVGEGMMMISYGYSGAGKTTTLIGDATAPVGGGRGIDGVLSLYLKENAAKIEDVQVRIFEVYGRIGAQDGFMKAQTGSGIWGYRLREKTAVYLGQSTSFQEEPIDDDEPSSGKLNLTLLEEKLDEDAFTYSIKAETPPAMSGTIAWHEKVKEVLTVIEDIRLDEDQFRAGGEPIAHIRGTVNNPKSSRGTLFVLTNIFFKNGQMAPVSTVDLAGSEDPAVMVSGFLRFKNSVTPRGEGLCDPKNGKMPKELMAKYLASLSSWELMSGALSWCYELRDVLVKCDPVKPARGCVNIILPSGEKEMVAPKLDKEPKWLAQDERGVELPAAIKFPAKGDGVKLYDKKKPVTFTREEILKAHADGPVEGLCEKRMETNPFSGDEVDMTWAERLWSRNFKSVGIMDYVILGVNNPSLYTKQAEGEDEGNVEKEIPRALTQCKKDANYGKWHDNDKVKNWKKAREAFFKTMREIIDSKLAEDNNAEFIRHLTYFTSAIGPIVEEAFFINEALNDMKGYLGIWAKTSQLSPPGTLLSLWPPKDFEVKGKDNQIVDYSDGSKISETGYDIFKFLKPKNSEESYAEQLAHGEDNIMLVTMLEYIRRISVRRAKNTKVLVGVFIRSDIPGADLDCDGAKASLQFAQDLSDMVGWNRGLPGVLPHLHQYS